jgi:hypothetical protein
MSASTRDHGLIEGDLPRNCAVVQEGLASPEHAAFIDRPAMAAAPVPPGLEPLQGDRP